jgi:hypothetical protein
VQLEYLRYLGRWPTAGGTFFPQVRDLADKSVTLCVTERGLHICDAASRHETQMFPYARLKTLGDVAGDVAELNVTAGTDHHEFRLAFRTDDARMIHDLLQDYIGILASTYKKAAPAYK